MYFQGRSIWCVVSKTYKSKTYKSNTSMSYCNLMRRFQPTSNVLPLGKGISMLNNKRGWAKSERKKYISQEAKTGSFIFM